MFIDGRTLTGETLDAELCIIGGGAAGIAIAYRLLRPNIRITLIESGGFDPERDTLALNNGEVTGQAYSLDATRLRMFGGSTNHWEGMCTPLDESDFMPRAWIEHSGWPIGKKDIEGYYADVAKFLNMSGTGTHDFSVAQDIIPNPSTLAFGSWRFAQNLSLGEVYREALAKAEHIKVIHHANLADIVLKDGLNVVSEIQCAALGGARFTIKAKHFVLACGGIENARLLLAANKQMEAGVGNTHGLVGRFFMDHPHNEVGKLYAFNAFEQARLFHLHFKKGRGLKKVNDMVIAEKQGQTLNITLSAKAMEKYQVGSGSLVINTIADQKQENPTLSYMRRIFGGTAPTRTLGLYARTEQVPNPESRITLAQKRDALGMPVASLHWALQRKDWDTIYQLASLFAQSASAAGYGVVRIAKWMRQSEAWPKGMGYGSHHMGTTRMHADARQGVVDADCRVHGIENLYIAGSSVFTTSGSANPTYTIIALAFRMADKLQAEHNKAV